MPPAAPVTTAVLSCKRPMAVRELRPAKDARLRELAMRCKHLHLHYLDLQHLQQRRPPNDAVELESIWSSTWLPEMRGQTLAAARTDVERARRAVACRSALALLLLCSACSTNAVFAAQGPARTEAAARVAAISQEDAANIVRQAYGGRIVAIVEATLDAGDDGGKPMQGHRIRVDVDGRVKTVFVDASGRIHEDARSAPRGKPE